MEIKEHITKKIKHLIENNQDKISITSLSSKLDVARNTIYNILNGKGVIDIELLYKLTTIYDVSINYFLPDSHQESTVNENRVGYGASKEINNRIDLVMNDLGDLLKTLNS